MNVLVLHGPTLQFLGERQGDPPDLTLAEVDRRLAEKARALGHVLRTVQTNHEGALVDALWEQRTWAEGVVLNPGPLAPGSHVLRAEIVGDTLTAWIDGHVAWVGTLPDEARELAGPAGLRTDNLALDRIELQAAAAKAAGPACKRHDPDD